jgi:hypothetical protein
MDLPESYFFRPHSQQFHWLCELGFFRPFRETSWAATGFAAINARRSFTTRRCANRSRYEWPRTLGCRGMGASGACKPGFGWGPSTGVQLCVGLNSVTVRLAPPTSCASRAYLKCGGQFESTGRCHYIMPEMLRQRGNRVVTNKTFWSLVRCLFPARNSCRCRY